MADATRRREKTNSAHQMEEGREPDNSLKVGYNRVLATHRGHQHQRASRTGRLPAATDTTGAERYVTPALKEFEEKVLTAAERIEERERELFEGLRRRIGSEVARLQCVGRLIAELDVLSALAEVAEREGYVRPEMTDGFDLEIIAGRHPVVERMYATEKFIPNDVRLIDTARMII